MGVTLLNMLKCGQQAEVVYIDTDTSIRRRLFDIGLIYKTQVRCVGESPLGDPHAYLIRGAVIALRNDDAKKIKVRLLEEGEHGTYIK